MPKVKGSTIFLEVEDKNSPGTYIVCAGQENMDIDRTRAVNDTTTKDSYAAGFKEYEADLADWKVSLDGAIELNDQGFDKLDDAFMNGDEINVRVKRINGKQYTGKGIITSFPISAPREHAKYKIEIQGTGPLVKAQDQA